MRLLRTADWQAKTVEYESRERTFFINASTVQIQTHLFRKTKPLDSRKARLDEPLIVKPT